MAGKRRNESRKGDEQPRKADAQAAILVAPTVTVVDIASGDSESLWVWELED